MQTPTKVNCLKLQSQQELYVRLLFVLEAFSLEATNNHAFIVYTQDRPVDS